MVAAQAILFFAEVDACDTLVAELTHITGECFEARLELPRVGCVTIFGSIDDATPKGLVHHVAQHGRHLC